MRGESEKSSVEGDAIATLTAGVLVIDVRENVVYANPAAANILRRPTNDLVGKSIGAVLCPLDDARPGRSEERPLVLADGTEAIVGFSLSAYAPTGIRTILFQDLGPLSELRRDRDRLLQIATLGDALPSLLHDLRNPLAAITSSLEVLVEEAQEPLRGELHDILWEVRRMNLTLQAVGGFTGAIHSKQHVAADHAVVEACRILRPTAERLGITLEARVSTLPLLPLDWGVLSGVVFNLVKNAIDACRVGDRIEVTAGLEAGTTFALRVRDTGEGMSEKTLAQCRELFFTSKENGSGVGLALIQEIATSAGGTLDVESRLGIGTTVTLRVPLEEPAQKKKRENERCHV